MGMTWTRLPEFKTKSDYQSVRCPLRSQTLVGGHIAMQEFCIQNTYIGKSMRGTRAAFTFLVIIGRRCKRLADKMHSQKCTSYSDFEWLAVSSVYFYLAQSKWTHSIRYLEIMASIWRSRIFIRRIVHFIAGELLPRWTPAGASQCDFCCVLWIGRWRNARSDSEIIAQQQ